MTQQPKPNNNSTNDPNDKPSYISPPADFVEDDDDGWEGDEPDEDDIDEDEIEDDDDTGLK